ncbi:MAG: TlpA family protein disulfide reductase [Dehalococcoidia bacterium]
MNQSLLRRLVAIALLGSALALVACGGGDESSEDLTWDSLSLQESADDAPFVPTILPTTIGVGPGRVLFALIDREEGTLVSDATMTARFYRLASDPEVEPEVSEEVASLDVVKRVLDLRGAAGTGESPLNDSDLTTVYSSTPELDTPGYWGVVLDIEFEGKQYQPRMKFWVLEETPEVAIGDPAPASVQPTLADVDDPAIISSVADPNEAMLDQTVAEALQTGKPVVVAFVTPTFCQTRYCGPVMEAVVQPAWEQYGDRVEFVHIEPYDLPKARAEGLLEPVPTVLEWGIRQEPFIFVIDAEGIVRVKLEGVTDLPELSEAIELVLAE